MLSLTPAFSLHFPPGLLETVEGAVFMGLGVAYTSA